MTDSIPTTTAPPADVAATIRAFLAEVVGDAPEPDEDIFARGTVTSLFALQLIAFVENTFGIEVEPEDLDFANFRTVDAVTAFVDGKRAATSRG
ncbi:acyl carrier protein [Micromonospora sp. WMMD1155]|uniref:acyl carrier protein n=1 Tax=Micromonospora sp. WMMD1155 TaxID=3016094 RepID=UPI00249B573E|nr:acyl carrier protein [Micromonospora sp. WMMD1155]WFE54782.1 acyl carrier protein [Micromonospora sp. WMMD1155]